MAVKHKDLKKVVGELKNASKMHLNQSKTINRHIEDMGSGFKMKGYSYPGQSPITKKCNCWKGYERVPGTKPCADKSCTEK